MEENYTIPQHIKDKFTIDFCKEFVRQLDLVFSDNRWNYEKTYWSFYSYHESTIGWHNAFDGTCRKFGVPEIIDYFDSLDWYDGDKFDAEFDEILCDLGVIPVGEDIPEFLTIEGMQKALDNHPTT